MSERAEIWYRRGSRVATLAKPLSRQYRVRELADAPVGPQSDRDPTSFSSSVGGAQPHAVFLADLGDEARHNEDGWWREPGVRVIGILPESKRRKTSAPRNRANPDFFACLPWDAPQALVQQTIEAALANIELVERERQAREELLRAEKDMEELNRIGVALSSQRDLASLLNLILEKARAITSADAGSLYLVEQTSGGLQQLRFKATQNDSCEFPFQVHAMPLSETSIAGYVALHGTAVAIEDAYHPSAGDPAPPYRFNVQYDERTGYRTRSVLALPMKNGKGEVLGVLQLINCKHDRAARLATEKDVDREVIAFPLRAIRMASSLASQAAVAYENSRLWQDIEALFEGFVDASITAIEQRDPSTCGHSQRVSLMTVSLAGIVDRVDSGPYAAVHFTSEQVKEIRYAALLHDFGKVAVREEVLVKAKKLYPAQREILESRFDYVRKDLEARLYRQKLELFLAHGGSMPQAEIAGLEEDYRRKLRELDDHFQFILAANEPTVLPVPPSESLREIARQTFQDPRGVERALLTPEEVRYLSIPQGSLDEDERLQIESHVTHSFNFLLRIPWTRELKEIPWIARAHHEKLNGTGYPHRLTAPEIPVQAKIMTICDIYDALFVADRPYKRSVPAERALEILDMSVRDHELDGDLFRLFVDARIYRLIQKRTGDS